MFRCCRKMMMSGLLISGLVGTYFLTPVGSYVNTVAGIFGTTFEENVPLDFEIKRVRQLIASLEPEINRARNIIAEGEADLEIMEDKLATQEARLGKEEQAMATLNRDLKNKDVFVYAGHSYTEGEVRNDLQNRLELCKVLKSTLTKNREILEHKKSTLNSNVQKLENMMAERDQLQADVDQLEAELRALEAAEIVSDVKVDDSRLSETKSAVDKIRKRILVRSKRIEADRQYTGRIELDAQTPADLEDQVADYFTGEKKEGKALIALDK
ncbi:Hypothetical protein PBC10988_37090 [Planctomycetales bacterium 10988]|nr:Hypothetical protein PBC10988_37090 [Planctomycetales bacterium 10988]